MGGGLKSALEARAEWLDLLTDRLRTLATPDKAVRLGILGALGAHDVGDEAMLRSLMAELDSRVPGISFVVFSTRPAVTEHYLGLPSRPTLHRWLLNRRSVVSIGLYGLDRAESGATRLLRRAFAIPEVWCEGWLLRAALSMLNLRVHALVRRRRDGGPLPGKSPLEVHVNDLADVDALLLLGGGYLNSWHVKASSYLYAISADAAADLNKPVFGTGLNLGPFNSIDSRRLSRTLRRFDLIGVRDRRESFAWLHAHGFLDPAIHRFSQDDAIGLVPTSEGREDLELLVAHLHPYIALQAHFWRLDETASDRLLATLADAAEQLVRRSGLRVLLIPMTFGNRARSDRDVLSHLPIDEGLKEHIVMAPDGLSPQQLKYLFANASGAIVTRHHGMMFALSAGVRCQAIILDPYYRQKLEGVAADFGELCTLLPLASLSSSALVNPWLGRGNWKSA